MICQFRVTWSEPHKPVSSTIERPTDGFLVYCISLTADVVVSAPSDESHELAYVQAE